MAPIITNKDIILPSHVLDFIISMLRYPCRLFAEGDHFNAGQYSLKNMREVSEWRHNFSYHQQASVVKEALDFCWNILLIIERISSDTYSSLEEVTKALRELTTPCEDGGNINDYRVFDTTLRLIEQRAQLIYQKTAQPKRHRLFWTDSRIEKHIDKLSSSDSNIRLKSIKVLGKIGDGRSSKALIDLKYHSFSPDESTAIIKALGKMGRKGLALAVEGLINTPQRCIKFEFKTL